MYNLPELIASALGGSLFTALVFVFAFSNKITGMSLTLTECAKKIDKHIENTPVCGYHLQTANDIQKLKDKVGVQ